MAGEITENNMEAINLPQSGTLPPELYAQQQELNRQQRMAQMLTQQGQQQPQGQMISGRYVAPSIFQNLSGLANTVAGTYLQSKGDEKALELAKGLRDYKTMENEAISKAAKAGDWQTVLDLNAQSYTGAGKEYVKAAVENLVPKATEPKVVGNNLVDSKGNVIFKAPKEYAPHAVQVIDTPNGLIQFDPNSRQMTPVMVGGQPLMGNKGALPEGANKQVTGATNLKSAIDNYKNTLQGFNTLDMLKPDARASMGNAYNNMMLQAKEAYNLGVLNGPDYAILQSVVKDPTSASAVLTSKKALEQQATDLGKQADVIISNVYKTHGRNVPQNMQNATPSAAPNAPAAPAQNFDPKLLQYMTPEQQALFSKPGK